MDRITLITGSARSGKSHLAEHLTLKPTGRGIYIATAEAGDAEMADRIAAHRARRGPEWSDIHAPLNLAEALDSSDGGAPRLVDCLTLWLSNLMLGDLDWRDAAEGLAEALARQSSAVVLVTNEVGAGIVPENALARAFRDASGWMNQRIAAEADRVILTVAGYPVTVKPAPDLP